MFLLFKSGNHFHRIEVEGQNGFCPVDRKAIDREKVFVHFFLLFKEIERYSMFSADIKENNIYFADFWLINLFQILEHRNALFLAYVGMKTRVHYVR